MNSSLIFEETLVEFVENYKKDRPKLAITALGAGVSLAGLMKVPGASSVINSMYFPYSEEETRNHVHNFVEKEDTSIVSKDMLAGLMRKSQALYANRQITKVIITGALETTRYRKGDNHAWIGIHYPTKSLTDYKAYHLKLSKLSEKDHSLLPEISKGIIMAERFYQDEFVSRVVLSLLEDSQQSELTERLFKNGQLTII